MIQIAPPQGRFITREKAKNPNSLCQANFKMTPINAL